MEVFLARLGDGLQFGDLFAQPLVLRLQLVDLGRHRLHVEELAVGAHLVAFDLLDVLLAAKAQVRQLLPLLGDLLAAACQVVGLLVDLLLQNAAHLFRLHPLRLLLPNVGPDAPPLVQALYLRLELGDSLGVLLVGSASSSIGAIKHAL
eukprot:1191035-Pleurochrysis_carterae.AAC.1